MAARANRNGVAVIGAGNMGSAFLEGLVASGYRPGAIIASDVSRERLAAARSSLGVRTTASNEAAARSAGIVVVAVKPQIIERVLADLSGAVGHRPVVISFAAGVPTAAIEDALGRGVSVVRAMPNLPAAVGCGATAVAAGRRARRSALRTARALLGRVGVVVDVDEDQMDAVTGLSGTGPMYVFIIIEALADAGVRVGLHRDVATRLSIQTVLGAAELVARSGKHPIHLKDMVTSPGGTAITALHSMERTGLRAVLMDAVQAATERSAELGRRLRDTLPANRA